MHKVTGQDLLTGGVGMATTSGRPGIFAVRDVRSLITETAEEGQGLKKAVGATHLTGGVSTRLIRRACRPLVIVPRSG